MADILMSLSAQERKGRTTATARALRLQQQAEDAANPLHQLSLAAAAEEKKRKRAAYQAHSTPPYPTRPTLPHPTPF